MRGVRGGNADVGCSEALGLVIGVDPGPRGREDVCEEPLGLGDRAGVDMVCVCLCTRRLGEAWTGRQGQIKVL
jgi:hypothetical protein